ncbi:MAG: hypothetical protein QOF57_521, partial [Frankiaceae bacterium]|nr:hypothetical protein [Frankiaceae bacterium]
MTADPPPALPSRRTGAVIGLLSVAAFLAVAQLASVFSGRSSAPVPAIGETFVDNTPRWLKEFAARTFGVNDKTVLVAGIFVVIALIAAAVGAFSVRRRWLGTAGIVAIAVIAGVSADGRPDAGTLAPLPAVAGAVGAMLAFRALLRATTPRAPGPSGDVLASSTVAGEGGDEDRRSATSDRRRFLVTSGGIAVGAVAAGYVGLTSSRRGAAAGASRESAAAQFATRSPAASPSAAVTTGAQLDVPGLSPFFTPNKDFYRIDTALSVPEIDATKWSLRIHGMVDHELVLTYADLLAMTAAEHDVTLCCVSNPVGGDLIGNARWTGVPLADVLAKAGVQPGATQLLSTSADGWTAGTPTAVVLDGRAALLAYGMNGEPLPIVHGFPVRLVVPGLYGYVSATKWLTDIELTTMDAKGYWITRGWSQNGPVKTQSRIDVPNPKNQARVGNSPIAGVAWSQHKGIAKVEVSIDGGPWLEARLAGEDVTDT